jgi:4-amino-4-deoxy-L-arabinose transferase-like glycosyltransferase
MVLKFNKTALFITIFLVAFGLRLIAIFNLPLQYRLPDRDATGYDNLAMSILNTKTFSDSATGQPTASRVPLYPFFLASIYYIFGHNYFWARFIQAILYSLLCIVVYLIAEKLFDKKVAFLSSAGCAVYQPFIYYGYYGGPGFLLSEHLMILLFAISVLFFARFYMKQSIFNIFWAGLFLGLSTLAKPITSLFIFFVFPWMLAAIRIKLKDKIRFWMIGFVSFFIVVLPWLGRNYFIFKKVSLTSESGIAFYIGNNPMAKGGGGSSFLKSAEYDHEKFKGQSEFEANSLYFKEGLKYIISHSQRTFWLSLKKVIILWYFKGDGVINVWYLSLLPLAILGIFFSFAKPDKSAPLLFITIFIYFSFIAACMFGEPRHRYSIEPYLIIFASIAVLSLASRFRFFDRMLL